MIYNQLSFLRRNYESEIREMGDQIEEMLQHYHDNDVEVYTQMSNTVTIPSLGFSTLFFES